MTENLKLELSKVIRASRRQAFAAWTQPEELLQWFAPGTMQAKSIDVDLRVGGVFRWTMRGPSPRDGVEMQITFYGEFLEVIENELLRFSWQSEANAEDRSIVEVAFRDVEGGVEVSLMQEQIVNSEIYNRNKMGWVSMLEKLMRLVESPVTHAG